MRRFVVGLAMVAALVGAACAGGAETAPENTDAVRIDSIEPDHGTIGTEVTIRGSGFDLENDVGIVLPNSDHWQTGFINDVLEDDPAGTILRFKIPELLGACAFSQADPNANTACPSIGLVLPVGEVELAVYNRNGTSQPVRFTREISGKEAAETAVYGSSEFAALTEVLDAMVGDSYNPSSGLYDVSYGVGIRDEDDPIYIELSIHGTDVNQLDIPAQIAGYEVRLQ